MPDPVTGSAGERLEAATMILSLRLGRPGSIASCREKLEVRRAEDDPKRAEPASAEALRVGKRILDSSELDAVRRFDTGLREGLRCEALPADYIRAGMYLIPVASVARIEERLTLQGAQRAALADSFLEVYPALIDKARTDLGELFDDTDYPSVGQMRRAFSIGHRWLTLSTPSKLREIRRSIWESERAKAAEALSAAASEIQAAMRDEFSGLVDHLCHLLTPGVDGRKRAIKEGSVRPLQQYLETFAARNVLEDADLAARVGDAAKLLSGATPESLRTDEAQRANLATGFVNLKAALAGMMVDRPRRAIQIERPSASTPPPAPAGEATV